MYHEDPIFASECSATLVKKIVNLIFRTNSEKFQIGGKWALTAAHCVFDDVTDQPHKAAMLSILLGLPNKRSFKRSNHAK